MKEGILYLGVDHWPSETAKDSSEHFGAKLRPYITSIIYSDKKKPLKESGLAPEIQCAVICNNGKMSKAFTYIMEVRRDNDASKKTAFRSSLKKGLLKTVGSFTQVKVVGHLFDTHGINEMMNLMTKKKMQFNFVHWNVGQ